MTGKSHTLFVVVFCIVIFGVGITQAVVELRRGETIQMLDLAEDTFVTPLRRANELAGLYDSLRVGLATIRESVAAVRAREAEGGADWYPVEAGAEEALASVEELRRRAAKVNRHIGADSTTDFPPFGEALRALPLGYDNLVTRASTLRYFRLSDTLAGTLEAVRSAAQSGDAAAVDEALRSAETAAGRMTRLHRHRSVLSAPTLALEHFFMYTVFSQRYLRAWEGEMEKTSVFDNTLRPPFQFARYMLLHDVTDKAVLGRNGWLFYKPGIEYLYRPYIRDPRSIVVDPNDKPLVDNPIAAAVRFRRQLEKAGVELLVVIVPGKGSIYPDMVNRHIAPSAAGTFSHSLRTIQDLRDSGLAVVDLFAPFGRERQNDSAAGDSMYLEKDTHWRTRGVRLAAGLVAERIRAYPWYSGESETTEYVLDTITVERVGDVGSMTGLPDLPVRELRLRFDTEPALCHQVYEVKRDGEGAEVDRVLYRDDFRRSQVLVLGDSFSRIYQTDAPRSAGWISHLAAELRQPVASIVSDGGASTLVRQTLARRPEALRGKKLVVWEFVERDLRFGAEGWQDVALDL